MLADLDHCSTDPQADFLTTLSAFPLPALLHLKRNIENLIRGKYFDAQGRGCVLYFLSGSRKRTSLSVTHRCGTDDIFLAARRMVRDFDSGRLTDEQITVLLDAEIARRQGACTSLHPSSGAAV